METRLKMSGNHGAASRREAESNRSACYAGITSVSSHTDQLPTGVRESVANTNGEYNARRLRSQREVIRDVMLAAADCDTWLTLSEVRALTRYGEASISAQLRHLRKLENGGYEVIKRHRDGAAPAHGGVDGRGMGIWEYRVARVIQNVI